MPKQPVQQTRIPLSSFELEIVLMNGDVIREEHLSRDAAKTHGEDYHITGLWIAGTGSTLVFCPGHRIRKMAIREKKPLSL